MKPGNNITLYSHLIYTGLVKSKNLLSETMPVEIQLLLIAGSRAGVALSMRKPKSYYNAM